MEKIILIIGGIYNLGFAVFHIFFWKIFRWKADIRSVIKINKGIMYVMNLCLIYVFLFFGYISIFHNDMLLSSKLGTTILIFISVFWFLRAIEQIFFFDIRKSVSIILTIIFIIGGLVYLIPVLN
ncbi:hypothetical protein H8E88_27015 [candidate division KSB1 bacterium]|nr:hypothetical protein [candidate division KSB1 bacterium]